MWRLLYQAALGLDYVLKKRVVHGGLKLNNILIGADGQAKLSDYGVSILRSCFNLSRDPLSRSASGELRWYAPECLVREPTVASDVYSFAMCMIEAALGQPPFAFLSDDDVRDNVRKGIIPDHKEDMASDVSELIVSMTNFEPRKRPPLQCVIDKLKAFADTELKDEEQAKERCCGVCSASILDSSRFCSQCGTQVGEASHIDNEPPIDNEVVYAYSTESASSTPPRPDSQIIAPALSKDMPILELLEVIQTGDTANCEQALLLLLQVCIDEEPRKLLYDVNGIVVLVEAAKTCPSNFGHLCALKCLNLFANLDSKFPRQEYEALRKSVRNVSTHELLSLTTALKSGNSDDKLKAVMCCACIAWATDSEELDDFRIVALIIPLLRNTNAR
ncbi:unnamed protein product [Phytophthora lilii]|uniref:Unnamed protein product n=1 Tax=Phytophthora lilii TaxID=2077276 RepID=A0A9W6TKV8_9STRA|nr:unnamed protein product [Phytophthora lilii]